MKNLVFKQSYVIFFIGNLFIYNYSMYTFVMLSTLVWDDFFNENINFSIWKIQVKDDLIQLKLYKILNNT